MIPKVALLYLPLVLLVTSSGGLHAADPRDMAFRIEQLQDKDHWRDALEALTHIGEAGVPWLIDALQHPNERVRQRVVWVLGAIGASAPTAVLALIDALEDTNRGVRQNAVLALSRIGPKATAAVSALINALSDADWEIRQNAAWTLGWIGLKAHAAVPALIRTLNNDDDARVRQNAAWALGWIGPEAHPAVPALIEALQDIHSEVSRDAAWALGEIGSAASAAVPALIEALHFQDTATRQFAARALGALGLNVDAAVSALRQARHDPDTEVRQEAAQALSSIERAFSSQDGSLQDDVASDVDEKSEEGVAAIPLPAEENPETVLKTQQAPSMSSRWTPFTHAVRTLRHSDLSLLKLVVSVSAIAAFLYATALVPLIWLYPRAAWARTAVTSGYFSKFPLLHKHLLASPWACHYVFKRLATTYESIATMSIPHPYIPQYVYGVQDWVSDPLLMDASRTLWARLFQRKTDPRWRPRVFVLSPSGSGKSVLLRHLLREIAQRFVAGHESKIPLFLSLSHGAAATGGIEARIRNTLTRGGVDLPEDVVRAMIDKGNFFLLMDGLDDVHDPNTLRTDLHAFLDQDTRNWVLMVGQEELLERADITRVHLLDVTLAQARTYLQDVIAADLWEHLPIATQMLTRKPQDLAVLGDILPSLRPEDLPTRRVDLYRAFLWRDKALHNWVKSERKEIEIIDRLAFRMLHERQYVLSQDMLVAWLFPQPAANHSCDQVTSHTIIETLQQSRMFTRDTEQICLGPAPSVVGFRHALMGQYLAARYLRSFVEGTAVEARIDLLTLSREPRWFEVFCFVIDDIVSPSDLNHFLRTLLSNQDEDVDYDYQHLLVAYALATKPRLWIDRDIRKAYRTTKREKTPCPAPLAWMREFRTIQPLLAALEDGDRAVRQRAGILLSRFTRTYANIADRLITMLHDTNPYICEGAAYALSLIKGSKVHDAFLAALEQKNLPAVAGAYKFFIKHEIYESEMTLGMSLVSHGHTEMAYDFLHSDNRKLQEEAKGWFIKYEHEITIPQLLSVLTHKNATRVTYSSRP